MIRNKQTKKIIAIFLTINFLQTFIPYNALYANNNGPKAPEAGSFEPVDATDMVSLLTGDVNYVLPLLDVPSPEGSYPLVLAYHAGIAYDQEASWVGLGWNLNPGVINRTINGYPDDWNGGLIRNRNYYDFEVETITVALGIGEKVSAEIGIGYSWDSNGSQSGSVSLSLEDSNTGLSASVGVGYHSSQGWSANAGVALSGGLGENGKYGSGSVGFSGDTNGNFNTSINYNRGKSSVGVSFGTAGLSVNANVSGIGSASYSSNNSTSADVTTFDAGVKIPIAPKTYLKLGYSKVKLEKDELYLNRVWGPLHYNKLNDDPKIADDTTYGNLISQEHNRDFFMDSYDQPLPEREEEVIEDKDAFEKYQHSFTNPAYDTYVVNAQGLSGTMKPRLLENGYLIGKGYKLEYETMDANRIYNSADVVNQIATDAIEGNNLDIAAFLALQETANSLTGHISSLFQNAVGGYESYIKKSAIANHHFDLSRRFNKDFGNGFNDIHFYFDHQLHSNLIINQNTLNSNPPVTNNTNNFFSGTHENRIGRVENTNFIETFTNQEIQNLISNNIFLESKDFDRSNEAGALPDAIGGYRITTADGKVYHYSQPVYHYEEFYRQLTPGEDQNGNGYPNENFSENRFYHEQRRTEPYATHWLLTAITGPDYVKRTSNSYPSEGDYGYWIRFDYGKWTDGYVWRNPYNTSDDDNNYLSNNSYKNDTYNNLTFDKNEVTQDYSWGRKQLVYLNKVVTRTHSALFVKSLREDNLGSEMGKGGFPSYENDESVYYPSQQSLKLDEIILVKNEDDTTNQNNTVASLIANANQSVTVNWSTMNDIVYDINQQNKILDSGDLTKNSQTGNYEIYDKAIKVIKLHQNYDLAKGTLNSEASTMGRLTLDRVELLGRKSYKYMPDYKFTYNGKAVMHRYCENYVDCDKDEWGYYKNDVALWSLNSIKTPTGATIEIEYEEDDYYTEAFARRFWTEGLSFQIYSHSDTEYKITVKNQPNFVDGFKIEDFRDYFNEGEKVALDLWICRRENCPNGILGARKNIAAFDLDPTRLTSNFFPRVFKATSDQLEIIVNKTVNYGDLVTKLPVISDTHFKPSLILGEEVFWQGNDSPATHIYDEAERDEAPPYVSPALNGCSDHHSMYNAIMANKIPVADSGGGIRAKSIKTVSESGDFYAVEYDYNHPFKDRSSGITSYAPVRGYKYVAYQAELPGPKVNYEYVTMSQKGQDGSSLGKTVYQFDVLKPALSIFSKNMRIGNHFKAEVVEKNLPESTQGAEVMLHDNTAMIGSLLKVSEYNSLGQLMNTKENFYTSFEELSSTNQGSLQESFLSMKSIYDFDARYVKIPFDFSLSGEIADLGDYGLWVNFTKNLYLENASTLSLNKRFANVSTKISYPIIQEKNKVVEGGLVTETKFLNPDPKTGEYLTTITSKSDGTALKTDKIPAYTKYSRMGSKVDNVNNKHMLTQEAMNIVSVTKERNLYGEPSNWKTIDANITTWKGDWDYRQNDGGVISDTNNWRKHQSFVWKDAVNPDGTYVTQVSENDFNWGVGDSQTNSQWQKISEVTQYTQYSAPVETADINGNYAASKMTDDFAKTIAGGNARYGELYYSGAEFVENGIDSEVAVSGLDDTKAHTGKYSAKVIPGGSAFAAFLRAGTYREGKYKVSTWVAKENHENARIMILGESGTSTEEFNGEKVVAGDWVQLNHYFDVGFNGLERAVWLRSNQGEVFYDDFRLHPVYASMNSYVYSQETDYLTFILDANNMATEFRYDDAGRLCKTYKEVLDTDAFTGGFKKINQYKYNYKDVAVTSCQCCEDEEIDYKPIALEDEYTHVGPGNKLLAIFSNDSFGGDGPASVNAYKVITQPSNGIISFLDVNNTINDPKDDVVNYDPNDNFSGVDSFVYEICDVSGDCAQATVNINVSLPPSEYYFSNFQSPTDNYVQANLNAPANIEVQYYAILDGSRSDIYGSVTVNGVTTYLNGASTSQVKTVTMPSTGVVQVSMSSGAPTGSGGVAAISLNVITPNDIIVFSDASTN